MFETSGSITALFARCPPLHMLTTHSCLQGMLEGAGSIGQLVLHFNS